MKVKTIFYIFFSVLFLAVFFFNVFPFPVEVATGKTFWNQWMFTSILYQLKVKAFLPAILMVAMFSLPFVGIKFWK
jgi:hypothetical protein